VVCIADKHILLKHFWHFLSVYSTYYCTLVLVRLHSLFILHLEMSSFFVTVKFCHWKKHYSATNDHFWHSVYQMVV